MRSGVNGGGRICEDNRFIGVCRVDCDVRPAAGTAMLRVVILLYAAVRPYCARVGEVRGFVAERLPPLKGARLAAIMSRKVYVLQSSSIQIGLTIERGNNRREREASCRSSSTQGEATACGGNLKNHSAKLPHSAYSTRASIATRNRADHRKGTV